MPWFSWLRRKSSTSTSPEPASGSRPIYLEGRESVKTGESHYLVPHGSREVHRLDMQHAALHEHFGTHHFAPVQQPGRILDVACGTGRWAKDTKERFPNASVTGIDITVPIDIQEQHVPTEYTFIQGNVLEPLPFPDASFDYVHMRAMFSALPVTKWPEVVRELVRVTAPGGWVELVEGGLPRNGGPALAQGGAWFNQLLSARGIDPTYARNIGTLLEAAGTTNTSMREEVLPIGPHGGKVGQMLAMDMVSASQLAIPALAQGLRLDQREVEANTKATEEEFFGNTYQTEIPIYIAYGQRPLAQAPV